MIKSKAVGLTKDLIMSLDSCKLEDLLKANQDYESIICSLIYSLGYESVSLKENNSTVVFWGAIGPSTTEIVSFNKNNNELSGSFKEDLKQAFELVFSIEHELSQAMLYPQNMRQDLIKRVQSRIGISQHRYETVLKNWKTQ
ncbi:hypothetical protein [Marinobacterium stanieri]|uniref:hypothetical protein n=1 Tax=Marinobacterium stanieri TaxID=49186 RepID=UPI000255A3B3|nr:hypothetical protein [Marinobacterium stanieri]